MKSVVDASFLITCPDFRINDTDAAKWIIGGENLPNDVNSHVYFGDKKMYKTYDLISNTKDEEFGQVELNSIKPTTAGISIATPKACAASHSIRT